MILLRLILALLLAFSLAIHGLKRKSLSTSGCVAAVFVGFITFATSYRFGIILICFYYSSSKLTKLKEDIKAQLEDDYQVGGQRDWIQVFSCSILAVGACSLYYLVYGEDQNLTFFSTPSDSMINLPVFGLVDREYVAEQLACAYVAHFATANGDTWASEIGILSPSRPRLVTSLFLKEVPPGTNGGMSLIGTTASAAGGAFIGAIYWLLSFFYEGTSSQFSMIWFGLMCGVLGSLVDSLLGATLQASYYSRGKKCIIKSSKSAKMDTTTQHICGYDVLSNESVNFLSIAITMMLSWYIAPLIIPLEFNFYSHA